MNDYPEKIPEGLPNLDIFPFSVKASKTARKDIEFQLDQVNSRIEKIIEHFVYSDIPILSYVLKVTTQKSELKKMAKAIDRLADLVSIQEDLSSRLQVVKLLETDPAWFAATFSDYSSEIDSDLSNIIDNL